MSIYEEVKQQIIDISTTLDDSYGSEKQRKLIVALSLPETDNMSVRDLCAMIGISEPRYYQLRDNEKFINNSIRAVRRIKGKYAPRVFQRYVRDLLTGDTPADKQLRERFLQDSAIEVLQSDKPETNAPEAIGTLILDLLTWAKENKDNKPDEIPYEDISE